MFQWIKGSAFNNIVTVSPTYVTLNNCAASHFTDAKWCLVGIDDTEKKMVIKPVKKAEIEKQLYPMESLHKVSVGTGYARISNKAIMQSLANVCDEPLANNAKYHASFDEAENMLIVDLDAKEE